MNTILERVQIQSRLVHIFSDERTFLSNHTFLDVFNSDTQRWEAQDPDFNVYYVDDLDGRRLSSAHLVFTDLSRATPISVGSSGWTENGLDPIRDHFEALMYDGRRDGIDTAVLVNTRRFDLGRRFPGEADRVFEAIVRTRYGDLPVIANEGLDRAQRLPHPAE